MMRRDFLKAFVGLLTVPFFGLPKKFPREVLYQYKCTDVVGQVEKCYEVDGVSVDAVTGMREWQAALQRFLAMNGLKAPPPRPPYDGVMTSYSMGPHGEPMLHQKIFVEPWPFRD